MKHNRFGFTIVELLIVIVVIGILAAISIVAYNNVQANARDSIRKQDLANIAKALQLYNAEKGDWMGAGSGCGYNGDGWGWFNAQGSGAPYLTSINNCLKTAGSLSTDIIDPTKSVYSTATSGFGYLKVNCYVDGRVVVYMLAKLETVPQSSTAVDAAGCAASTDTSYGMNYFVKVN